MKSGPTAQPAVDNEARAAMKANMQHFVCHDLADRYHNSVYPQLKIALTTLLDESLPTLTAPG